MQREKGEGGNAIFKARRATALRSFFVGRFYVRTRYSFQHNYVYVARL